MGPKEALHALALLSIALAASAEHARQLEAAAQPAIVGGSEAPRNRFPYAVQLRLNNANKFLVCGGTLIADRFVLTAAHCVVNSTDGKRYPTAQFRPLLRVGAHFLDPNAAGDSYEQRKVIATAVHSGYIYRDRVNPVTDPFWVTEWNNDIALLMLDRPVTNKAIPQLPPFTRKPALAVDPEGGKVTPIGWGVRNARTKGAPTYADMSPVLKQVALPFLSLEDCNLEYSGQPQREAIFTDATNTMVCAGLVEMPNAFFEQNTCYGDSGGPAVAASATKDPTKDVVVGVTSWGALEYDFGGGDIQNCQGAPSVFTNVAQLRPWIDDTMKRLLAGSWAGSVVGRANLTPGLLKLARTPVSPATVVQTVAAVPGRKVNLLTFSSSYSLTGTYIQPNRRTTALGLVAFKWGAATVSVQLVGTTARVFVNGVRVLAPRSTAFGTNGNVTYSAPSRATVDVTITVPGLQIKVQQPYVASALRHSLWLNVAVSMSQVPPLPLTGVIGATFPVATLGKDEWANPTAARVIQVSRAAG